MLFFVVVKMSTAKCKRERMNACLLLVVKMSTAKCEQIHKTHLCLWSECPLPNAGKFTKYAPLLVVRMSTAKCRQVHKTHTFACGQNVHCQMQASSQNTLLLVVKMSTAKCRQVHKTHFCLWSECPLPNAGKFTKHAPLLVVRMSTAKCRQVHKTRIFACGQNVHCQMQASSQNTHLCLWSKCPLPNAGKFTKHAPLLVVRMSTAKCRQVHKARTFACGQNVHCQMQASSQNTHLCLWSECPLPNADKFTKHAPLLVVRMSTAKCRQVHKTHFCLWSECPLPNAGENA